MRMIGELVQKIYKQQSKLAYYQKNCYVFNKIF